MNKSLKKSAVSLKKGDIVDLVSPGFASHPNDVRGSIAFLKNWGLVPRFPKKSIEKHFLNANTDEKRFAHLKNALLAKDSSVIWCLRGGYGSIKLLPFLQKMKKPKKAKLLIGISDITSLHIFLNQKWNWPTLHGPLLDRLGAKKIGAKYEKELKKILWGEEKEIIFTNLKPLNSRARKLKKISASVVGGNMAVLQSTLGTPAQLSCKGKILFLEDIGERGYRLDRMFEHLDQAGVFKSCRALVLGDFIGGEEPKSKKDLGPRVFQEWAKKLKLPVFIGMQAGHAVIQRPVPLNTKAVLEKKSGFQLKIQTGI